MNWQPIDTAPLGTETVLLYAPDTGKYGYPDPWIGTGYWESRNNAWLIDPGADVDICALTFEPTHWKPLPAVPGDSPLIRLRRWYQWRRRNRRVRRELGL